MRLVQAEPTSCGLESQNLRISNLRRSPSLSFLLPFVALLSTIDRPGPSTTAWAKRRPLSLVMQLHQ